MIAIRAPHGQRSRTIPVATSRKSLLEIFVLTVAWMAFFTPFVWMSTSVLSFADYPLRPIPYACGIVLLISGLWLFHRSHADLGTNWSITLELREKHQLVTWGSYRLVRHPMYVALLLYSLGQALVLPKPYRRSVIPGRDGRAVRPASQSRRTDDAGSARTGLRNLRRKDQAAGARRLVTRDIRGQSPVGAAWTS
jgi:hypothetical protein